MARTVLAATILALFASAHPVSAQEMDMAQMMKWGEAKLLRYHAEGIHEGKESVTAGQGGYGDIKDRVVLDFNWDLSSGLKGTVSFQNGETSVANLRDYESKCLPPVLKGPLEFWTVQSVQPGNAMTLVLNVKQSYPNADVSQVCSSRKAVPAKTVMDVVEIEVPSPVLFGMGAPKTREVEYVKDRQVIIVRKGNWTWTFTPTVAKK